MPDFRTILIWLLGAALAAALATVAIERTRTAEARLDLSNYKATAAESDRLAARAERVEETRYQSNTMKVINEARAETIAARDTARRADAAAGRLQRQLASIRTAAERARANSASSGRGEGESSSDAIGVFAGLLERADRRAGIVERYADALRIAGRTCERYADGLQPAAQ